MVVSISNLLMYGSPGLGAMGTVSGSHPGDGAVLEKTFVSFNSCFCLI